MKKIIISLFVVLLAVSPAFCGGEGESKSKPKTAGSAPAKNDKSQQSASPVAAQAPVSEPSSEKPAETKPVAEEQKTQVAPVTTSPEAGVSEKESDDSLSSISKPAAVVNLISAVTVYESDISDLLEYYKQNGVEVSREDVLDAKIEDELLSQAIERAGYTSYITQVSDAYLKELRSRADEAFGRTLTDDEFEQFCIQNFGSGSESIGKAYGSNYVLQNFVMEQYADRFEGIAAPTEDEITSFYATNKKEFFTPDYIKLSHIYFAFGDEKTASLAKAAGVASKIRKDQISFEDAVKQYSEDPDSKDNNGDIGYLTLDDEQSIQAMGDNFVKEAFKVESGNVSNVIESNIGYHIVKVFEHGDAKILELDDPINPTEDAQTLREYITDYLLNAKYEQVFEESYSDLLKSLRDEASIRIL